MERSKFSAIVVKDKNSLLRRHTQQRKKSALFALNVTEKVGFGMMSLKVKAEMKNVKVYDRTHPRLAAILVQMIAKKKNPALIYADVVEMLVDGWEQKET